jgi:hypothetical protein
MLTDSSHTELLIEENSSKGRMLIAVVCALAVTAIFVAGYTYLRKRSAQQRLAAEAAAVKPETSDVPKGPAKAHILVDEALLKGGQTIIGGMVKNISEEKLTALSVELELRRRKDGSLEQLSTPLQPTDLEPNEEGRYSLKLPAQQYNSVRLVGLKEGPDSSLLAYTTALGQKRPPERIQPKVITVPRTGQGGEFLNSPDNPARVP